MGPSPSVFYDGRESSDPVPVAPDDRPGIAREIGGGLLLLVSLYVTLCLILGEGGARLVGPVGEGLRNGLVFLFGGLVSYAVPIALTITAARLLLRRSLGIPKSAWLGIAFIALAVCGFLALPTADVPEMRQVTFQRAGAFGAFLVEWEGIGLVGAFGSVGTAFILGAIALAGIVLTTGFGFGWAGHHAVHWIRQRENRRPATEYASLPDPEEAAALASSARVAIAPQEEPAPTPTRKGPARRAPEFTPGFDEDADAALRALEEAEMDREFELALQRELQGAAHNLNTSSVERAPEIKFDVEDKAPRILSGNPANPAPMPANEAKARVSKLFASAPARPVAPPPPTFTKQEDDFDPPFDMDNLDTREVSGGRAENSSRESDPIFNELVDARPAGPLAGEIVAHTPAVMDPRTLRLPDVALLDDPPKVDNRMSREEILEISQTLEKTFADFGIAAKVVEVKQGPVVTRFELKPAPGVKVSRIASLEHDLAMAMKAVSVRILAPIPGKAVVGIEIPNRNRAGVYLKELISCPDFWDHSSPLAFALGKTIEGNPHFCDLRKMPHLLIAGATGAGKSVCLNSIISSILYRQRPDQVRMIMVDPKRVELSIYDQIPHLIAPVICEPKRAAAALAWAVDLMEDRYKKLVEFNVRNIDGYNAIVENPKNFPKAAGKRIDPMPYVVIVVDELADLMITAKNEVEESIQRLAQMARAVGIHLILATQRPSVNVITGIIKANFPSRIAFQVSQKVDSRTILDQNGAEALLGRGDMLFSPGGQPKPLRVQGCFMSDQEVERIVDFWKAQSPPMYEIEEFEPVLTDKEKRELAKMMGNPEDMDMLDGQGSMMGAPSRGTNKGMGKISEGLFIPHAGGSAQAGEDDIDEALVRTAARVILEGQKGSTSLVQRRLKVGFARAGRLMDMLEDMGIVGPYKGSKPREILVDCDAALAQLDELEGRDGTHRRMAAADAEDEDFEVG
jgi:S-DNA-T family DNA segregation ATPase FtsK/SpoIIIE